MYMYEIGDKLGLAAGRRASESSERLAKRKMWCEWVSEEGKSV